MDNAGKIYRTLLQLQDDDVTNETFKIINGQLFAVDTEEKVNDIIKMLKTDDDGFSKSPRQELLSYFAKLLAFIIHDEEQFDSTFNSFEDYAQRHQDSPIRDRLPFDIGLYENYISGLSVNEKDAKRKQEKLAQVWKQMP